MPGVFLSLAKELSFLLVESLESGELDAAFAYGTSERPGLALEAQFTLAGSTTTVVTVAAFAFASVM